MSDVFCKIAGNKTDSFIIYRSKKIIAFLDNQPFSKGHTLIIPVMHCTGVEDAPSAVLKEMFSVSISVSRYLKKRFKFDGITFLMNSGRKLQDVGHLHLHVYGRNIKDRKYYFEKFKTKNALLDDLAKVSADMKKALRKTG